MHRSSLSSRIDRIARSTRHAAPLDAVRHRIASWSCPICLRLATDDDRGELEQLAELDSRTLPPGPHLVAEREGWVRAALSVSSGELVADPFTRTAELGELLRCLAGGLRTAPRPEASASLSPQPRLVTA